MAQHGCLATYLYIAFAVSLFRRCLRRRYRHPIPVRPRGRLIQVSDSSAREINYTYDEAGNRVTVADETAGAPVITSFTGPMSVSTAGASVTLSWTSTGTRFCELISPEVGDTLNLPVNGSKSIGIYQDTGVTLKCYNGTQYDSAGKLIRFSGGGSKN